MKPKLLLFVLSSFLFCLGKANDDCDWTPLQNTTSCPHHKQNAIYYTIKHGKYTVMCCKSGSDGETEQRQKIKGCHQTDCTPTSAAGDDLCKSLSPRFVDGKQIKYIETVRDDCLQDDKDSSPGVGALCCPSDSKDIPLTTLLVAEKNQFPYFARLEAPETNCGGTIYNERFIITASHCATTKDTKETIADKVAKAYVGMWVRGFKTENEYLVKKFHVHPKSTRLAANPEGPEGLICDIAIAELDTDIKFGENIKAIPIAEPGFDPLKYGEYALLTGFGATDTGVGSKKLQKTDTYMRTNEREVGHHGPYKKMANISDQLMFLGGYQDGIASPGSGKGDSGGPAVCRNENDEPVLCGLDSKGLSNVDDCDKYKDEDHCIPTAWARVSYFRDWIVSIAGDQSKAEVFKEPLYGKYTEKGQYENQVHIQAADGHVCGGTWVSQNAVVTAAHCVVTENGRQRKNLKVTAGISSLEDLKSGQTLDVKNIKVLDGFERKGKKQRGKRIAVYAANATFTDPYFKNDLAVVTLSGNVNIGKDKIAKISKVYPDGKKYFSAKAVGFRTEKTRYGNLSLWNFNILAQTECQTRLDRLHSLGYDIKLDENVMCGVEKYSGGSLCDRELGGGLFCTNDKGQEELCGVQTFRFCEFSVPNAFLNLGKHNDWIQSAMK